MADRYIVAIGQNTNRYVVLDKKDGEPGVRICIAEGPVEARAIADRLNQNPILVLADLITKDASTLTVRVETKAGPHTFHASSVDGVEVLAEILGAYVRSISTLYAMGYPEWVGTCPIRLEEPIHG